MVLLRFKTAGENPAYPARRFRAVQAPQLFGEFLQPEQGAVLFPHEKLQ
jgi:hypothetical protein